MPRINARPGASEYVLEGDRELPAGERVTWGYREPNPVEVAEFEARSGRFDVGSVEVKKGKKANARTGAVSWVSNSAPLSISVLLEHLTAVEGTGPDGPLSWPDKKTDRINFLGMFEQADLYEVAEHILEGRQLTDDERGN